MTANRYDRLLMALNAGLILGLCYLAAGCTGAQVAATGTQVVLTADQLAGVEQLCQAALPGLTAASAPGLPATVSQTATYAQAYCTQLLAGGPPATTTASTPTWLSSVISATKVAAQIAGIVLPLL